MIKSLNFSRAAGCGLLQRFGYHQPHAAIVSDDVAAALADVALGEPINGMVELAGPEPIRQDELVRQFLSATGDPRKVITDVHALYYGVEVNDQSLVPGDDPRLGPTRFEDWLSHSLLQK